MSETATSTGRSHRFHPGSQDLAYAPSMGERRWLALDGLRGVAVLMVLVDHGGFAAGGGLAAAGVTVFFVLSGFLITNLIVTSRNRDDWSMPRFLMARAVRLMPALLLMEAVVLTWWLLAGRPFADAGWQMLATTFYFKNMTDVLEAGELMSHAWSLATEEQFYLLWPLILPFVVRRRSPLLVIAMAVLVSMSLRIGLTVIDYGPWAYAMLPTNAFALLLGCLLVIDPVNVRPGRVQRLVPMLCLAGVLYMTLAMQLLQASIVVPALASLFAFVMVAFSLPGAPLLEVAWLRFVGRISYSLYLWHWPVLVLLGDQYGGVSALAGLGLSFVLAVASTLLVEEPLRRRWRERRRSTVEVVRA